MTILELARMLKERPRAYAVRPHPIRVGGYVVADLARGEHVAECSTKTDALDVASTANDLATLAETLVEAVALIERMAQRHRILPEIPAELAKTGTGIDAWRRSMAPLFDARAFLDRIDPK